MSNETFQVISCYDDEEGHLVRERHLPPQDPDSPEIVGWTLEEASATADELRAQGYDVEVMPIF